MKSHRQITNEWIGQEEIEMTTKGNENCQWNENISAIFVVNKQL